MCGWNICEKFILSLAYFILTLNSLLILIFSFKTEENKSEMKTFKYYNQCPNIDKRIL